MSDNRLGVAEGSPVAAQVLADKAKAGPSVTAVVGADNRQGQEPVGPNMDLAGADMDLAGQEAREVADLVRGNAAPVAPEQVGPAIPVVARPRWDNS